MEERIREISLPEEDILTLIETDYRNLKIWRGNYNLLMGKK